MEQQQSLASPESLSHPLTPPTPGDHHEKGRRNSKFSTHSMTTMYSHRLSDILKRSHTNQHRLLLSIRLFVIVRPNSITICRNSCAMVITTCLSTCTCCVLISQNVVHSPEKSHTPKLSPIRSNIHPKIANARSLPAILQLPRIKLQL